MSAAPTYAQAVLYTVALSTAAVAAAMDVRRNLIRNWLTLPVLGMGLLLQTVLHGLPGLLNSLSAVAATAAILTGIYLVAGRGLGGGDLKLLAALAAVLGWPSAGWLLLYSALACPLVAVPVMLRHGIFWRTWRNLGWNLVLRYTGCRNLSVAHGSAGPKLPFAVAIMLGLLVLVFRGPLTF